MMVRGNEGVDIRRPTIPPHRRSRPRRKPPCNSPKLRHSLPSPRRRYYRYNGVEYCEPRRALRDDERFKAIDREASPTTTIRRQYPSLLPSEELT